MIDAGAQVWERIRRRLPRDVEPALDGAELVSLRADAGVVHVVLSWRDDDRRPVGATLANLFVELSEACRGATGLTLELWIRPERGSAVNVLGVGSA